MARVLACTAPLHIVQDGNATCQAKRMTLICLRADTAKSGEICKQLFGGSADASTLLWSVPLCGSLAAACYFLKPNQLDQANGVLLMAVLLSFVVMQLCFLMQTAWCFPEIVPTERDAS